MIIHDGSAATTVAALGTSYKRASSPKLSPALKSVKRLYLFYLVNSEYSFLKTVAFPE